MGRLRYEDFELKIERAGDGYRAEVLRSPGGEASRQFALPLSRDRIEILIMQMGQQRRRQRTPSRRVHSPEMKAARELGGTLFDSVFAEDIRACFRTSLDRVSEKEDIGLRIKLQLEQAPELADLPWELLLDESSDRFLSLSVQTPIVRYHQLTQRISPLRVKLPLQILVMVSSPSGYAALDVEREQSLLEKALEPLRNRNQVDVTYVERATLRDLHRTLRKRPCHVFHFIGHGGFDRATDEGVLLLEDKHGRGQEVDGHRLATVLQNRGTLRLAVLNACEGARISQADPYAGVATSLIKQGVPAVIAMQFEITDTAALAFADELYSALVDGLPVDAAVADARTAIYALPSDIEWGTPVLYMRAKDGVLFDAVESAEPVGQGRSEKETGTTAQPPSRPRRPAAQPEVRQNQSLGIVHIALADVTPMRFVGLTGGTFTMGNPVSEKGRSGDETEHEVTVLGFEIAEAVVTQKQWQAVMGSNPSYQFENSGNSDEHPVQSISWYDAIEFANKLSRREGLPECYEVDGTNVTLRGSCTGYRLPTEAEWEYACRAGSQTAYGRGVDESALSEYAWYGKLWEKGTVAVKSLKPNAWGLYGMHGNVWEWVWDRYASYPDSAQSDPHGPSDDDALLMNIDDTKSRVLRGGAFLNGAEVLRCALRFRGGPGDRFRYNGLRVVRRARRQP